MSAIEKIREQLRKLPESLQGEVLDFIQYLVSKKECEADRREARAWSSLSLHSAMRDMEDEVEPVYGLEDLRERFS